MKSTDEMRRLDHSFKTMQANSKLSSGDQRVKNYVYLSNYSPVVKKKVSNLNLE